MNAVVFDMDGLMFDTERLYVKAWSYAGLQLGLGDLGYLSVKTLGMTKEGSRAVVERELGIDYPAEELSRCFDEFFDGYFKSNHVPVKEGLYTALDTLKAHSFKLAVASSTAKARVAHHLKDAGVYDYFDAIICGDMVTHSKPHPQIYLTACEALGEAPENCFALEDSRSGLLSAYNAGCRAIMIPDLWQADETILSLPIAIVEDLNKAVELMLAETQAKRG